MNTLILDSSHRLLVAGVIKDGQVVAKRQEPMAKKQSEYLITFIDSVLEEANVDKKTINKIVLTDGPGSYTGLRIAMTFVKVFSLMYDIEVYTIDTLLSVAGLSNKFVMLDARSKRVFGGQAVAGEILDERIYQLEEVMELETDKIGDLSLIGFDDQYGDIVQNIADLEAHWVQVQDIDLLVPRYLS